MFPIFARYTATDRYPFSPHVDYDTDGKNPKENLKLELFLNLILEKDLILFCSETLMSVEFPPLGGRAWQLPSQPDRYDQPDIE